MKRITFEGNFCDIARCESTPGGSYCESGSCSQREAWKRLKAYEDTGLTPEDCAEYRKFEDEIVASGKTFGRLVELLRADREGRVEVLPCQSGEHVFALLDDKTHVWECEVAHAVLDGWRKVFSIRPVGRAKEAYYAPFGAFGKTVFLTREEAEEALRRAENER